MRGRLASTSTVSHYFFHCLIEVMKIIKNFVVIINGVCSSVI